MPERLTGGLTVAAQSLHASLPEHTVPAAPVLLTIHLATRPIITVND